MMKAMILAAGLGTRLRPLTNTIPKPLLPVGGTPLIVWNLLLLRACGIRDVIINLHYLGHAIEAAIGDGSRWNMQVRYSHEPTLLGTGGGLKAAEWFFEQQPFLVINGDTLIELNVKALITFHQTHGGIATLVLRDDPQAARWGAVESDAQNRILRINGRGRSRADVTGPLVERMFAGVHILHPSLLHDAPADTPFSIIDSYTKELARGSKIFGFLHAAYWSDIGTVARYAQAQADAETGVISPHS
ncbi:MAG: nucleotidyl transferase [Nitrospirae bacterium CG_4_9_14_3_um_filter_51_5]|nr:MAG: nucleotidyl transferase [Nitrospirae bacterium CG_4_9_14_3_um_filter_51_5]